MKHARFPTSPLSRRTFLEAAASLGAATLLPGERGKASGTLPTSDAIRAPDADLKWSATNVYREDEQGRPVYNWTATDHLFDVYAAHDVTPFVEVGFMP